jgi:hypothetical protein
MAKRVLLLIVSILLAASITANAQSLLTTKNVEVRFQNYMLRGALLDDGSSSGSEFLRDYYGRSEVGIPPGTYLATYNARLYGLEVYEMSRMDLALEGLGMGASMGLFAGALAQSFGAWDEDKTWLLVGAMSALGAVWGAKNADDPGTRIRVRWEPEDQ